MTVSARQATRVLAPSYGLAQELAQVFRLPPAQVVTIPNPVDLEEVRVLASEPVPELEDLGGRPIVLTVGRLSLQKNHILLLRAFRRVRQEVDAALVLVGAGELEGDLRRLAEELGIAPWVRFLGWQPNPFRFMRRADLFVLSSDYEGFGNVLVEAMACGCPVISTDCPYGPVEILGGGRYGILVPVGDEEGLARGMVQVLQDSALRQRLREGGQLRAQEFDVRIIARQYEELFRSVARDGILR
jgi:glycosyltransferase involved in cell wall biosynthesis